ncbi:putative transport transmembrane protein [Mesorhizobium amorphae CCNWGS0123]|uniref:Putative transport transmembrane protein n=1 Tax=Mesorhizobium amorphae CCNWGS0123 TaxID=1082933 RepID=G6YME3_9HYPH|nr:putative transport transmembrane protein [Mesorhizobium amorphae CCNWGS0123]
MQHEVPSSIRSNDVCPALEPGVSFDLDMHTGIELGWLVQTVAISWLMVTISRSDLMVALVQVASTLPVFFLSILAGAIGDNFSRRRVMFAGHCLIALASTTLMISVGLGFVSPWLILGLGSWPAAFCLE